MLGARIGQRVHLHRGVKILCGAWDLLTIGDDVTIGRDAALRMLDFENHEMVIGRITIGEYRDCQTKKERLLSRKLNPELDGTETSAPLYLFS